MLYPFFCLLILFTSHGGSFFVMCSLVTNERFSFSDCARDYKMYQHQLTCDGSGNYIPVQSVINAGKSSFFCVDSDGYPKTNFFVKRIDNCTEYY